MKKLLVLCSAVIAALCLAACGNSPKSAQTADAAGDPRPANYAKAPRFRILLYYSYDAEDAHVEFAEQSRDFFKKLTVGNGFYVDETLDLREIEDLSIYNAILMFNNSPQNKEERELFENYMENGGGWIGFHFVAYNNPTTGWPWLNEFLGIGTYGCNQWPPQPALAVVNNPDHPVMKNLPQEFMLPASEFYQFNDPVTEKDNIEVLLSLSPKNYPIGLKDIVYGGDWPVVWTNKNYRMIYINMGHGDEEYIDAEQNVLFINALRWIISRDPNGNPFDV